MIERHGVLVFGLGVPPRWFALPLRQVREVVRAVVIAALPGAPPIVEGVIDVRGELVPVLDIRARFELPPAELSASQRLVLVRTQGRKAALRVDQVIGIEHISADRWTDRAEILRGAHRIAGVARLAGELVLLHDLDTFLDDEEAASLTGSIATYERLRS